MSAAPKCNPERSTRTAETGAGFELWAARCTSHYGTVYVSGHGHTCTSLVGWKAMGTSRPGGCKGLGGGQPVLMDQAAEHVLATDREGSGITHRNLATWHPEVKAPVGALGVVMLEVLPGNCLKVTTPEHERPIEALVPRRPDKALGKGVGPRRADRAPGSTAFEPGTGVLQTSTRSKLRAEASWHGPPEGTGDLDENG
jgi:hypothetical protein